MLCLFRSLICHSANARHLSGVESTDIDLVAGGEPQPVAQSAASQAVTKPAVEAEHGRS